MKTYPVGNDVTVVIPLLDRNGSALVPTGLNFAVRDQNGTLVKPFSEITVSPGMTEVSVLIPAVFNATITELVEARVVELQVTHAGGIYSIEQVYLLTKPSTLVIMGNSFQTMPQAHAEAAQLPNLLGWSAATDNDRAAALIEAYLRLTRLGYRVRRPEDVDVQNMIGDLQGYIEIIEPRLWPLMTKDRWLSSRYPEHFRRALRRAQIAEANEILRGDRINEKRRSGIMSETIGESSMMFRIGKPLDLGISSPALEYVTGYVVTRITLTRS